MNWVTKYQPRSFEEVVFPNNRVRNRFISLRAEAVPNLLLHGYYGTGKSTLAKLLPIELGADPLDVRRINGSEDTSIEMVRQLANVRVPLGRYEKQIIIIDECDGLSRKAQLAFKGVLDQTEDRFLFIFTTNHLGKVDEGIVSRCECHQFVELDKRRVVERCKLILEGEQTSLSLADITKVLQSNMPDMRKIIIELQRLATTK